MFYTMLFVLLFSSNILSKVSANRYENLMGLNLSIEILKCRGLSFANLIENNNTSE